MSVHRPFRGARLAVAVLASALGVMAALAQPLPGARAAEAASAGRDPVGMLRLPHELHPDQWPQPDYLTVALKNTAFQPNSIDLHLPRGVRPEWLVLPVQMQAFGWDPAFAALAAAHLDQALALRKLKANRQTDWFNLDGPFLRRVPPAEVARLGKAHPNARVLALYLGRDAAGKMLATITLRHGGRLQTVHRSLPESNYPEVALQTLTDAWGPMLAELGLGAATPGAAAAGGCPKDLWALRDPRAGESEASLACRALLHGVLLPRFDADIFSLKEGPQLPGRLAWLARAHAQADALPAQQAAAVKSLVWSGLGYSTDRPPLLEPATMIGLDDPVLQPLARLLSSSERMRSAPTRSPEQAALDEAQRQADRWGLPAFARALLRESTAYGQDFRAIDLCSLEAALPGARPPSGCNASAAGTARPAGAPSQTQRELLEAWRLSGTHKALKLEGIVRGQQTRWEALIAAMPAAQAAHPFIRHQVFVTQPDMAVTGDFSQVRQRTLRAVTTLMQAKVDMQWLAGHDLALGELSTGRGIGGERLRRDPAIEAVIRDEARMQAVMAFDGFRLSDISSPDWARSPRWTFLEPGPMVAANPAAVSIRGAVIAAPAAVPGIGGPVVPVSPLAPTPGRLFTPGMSPPAQRLGSDGSTLEFLEQAVARAPEDWERRLKLAMARMKRGQSATQAWELLDRPPTGGRQSSAVAQANQWAAVGSAFFFIGEMDFARKAFERAAEIGTGSEGDLQSQLRLKLIAGDLPGAYAKAQERLARYRFDFARRDVAGLGFITGHADQAWPLLLERIQLSDQFALWTAVEAGQRIEGRSARQVGDWLIQKGLRGARSGDLDVSAAYLNRYLSDDRIPSVNDQAQLAVVAPSASPERVLLEVNLRLHQLAFEPKPSPADLKSVRTLLDQVGALPARASLEPLLAWTSWRALGGDHADLAAWRAVGLEGDFDALLAKAVLQGLDGRRDDAMRYLRAARIELSQAVFHARHQEVRDAPYTLGLMSYLLFEQTGDEAYRREALVLARAYATSFPYVAWSHALEALLAEPGPQRTRAACRAAFLDSASMFLQRAQSRTPGLGKTCLAASW